MSPPTPEELLTAGTEWHPQYITDENFIFDLKLTDDHLQYSEYNPQRLDTDEELIPSARTQSNHF